MKIVAEIGLQHCGCLGTALSFIDAVADAGADAAKLQCHQGDRCTAFRDGTFFPQDKDRAAYLRRTSFIKSEWEKIANRCKVRGIEFGCSVWSVGGMEIVAPFVDWWKVPSGEVTNEELARALVATKKPIVLSSGMSGMDEIRELANWYYVQGVTLTVLQCTTAYPCPPEKLGLNLIAKSYPPEPSLAHWMYAEGGGYGLSDHSGTIFPGIIAAWEGASMLEVHVCWDKRQWGPDVAASLTIDELWQLVQGVRFVERMGDSPVDKDKLAVSKEIQAMRETFKYGV